VTAAQKTVFFPAGSILFHEGEAAEGAFFIITGEVSTTMESSHKGRLPLAHIAPPAYLALVDSIAGSKYTSTGRAVRDTRGIFIPRCDLLADLSAPEAKLDLLRALANEVSGSYRELRVVRDKFAGRSASRRRRKSAPVSVST
jgi:CRP-like cAMP-binding protein